MITIPEKVLVGFQKRDDTFSGSLGYVVYRDSDGDIVTISPNAWDRWRDSSIAPVTMVNRPKDGFMLNRDIQRPGSRSWSGRSVIRVWDPDGWEFEITPVNLLRVMEYCDTNRKEIRGACVYSWDYHGTLVLLPVGSPEYQEWLAEQATEEA